MLRNRQQLFTLSRGRSAMTLVELLVAMSIFVVLASLTVTGFRAAANADRVGEAASTLRAKLEGARSRAIKSKEPRGVRLMVDPPSSSLAGSNSLLHRTITSIAYLDAPEYLEGFARIEFLNDFVPVSPSKEYDGTSVKGVWAAFSSTHTTPYDPDASKRSQVPFYNWSRLYQEGLITSGCRIVIDGQLYRLHYVTQQPAREWGGIPTDPDLIDYMWVISPVVTNSYEVTGSMYQPEFDPDGMGGYSGRRPYNVDPQEIEPAVTEAGASPHGLPSAAASRPVRYRIYLSPQLIDGTAPIKLPRNTTIDLLGSKVPKEWWQELANGADGFDIMFTPQGRVDRELLGEGYLHLRLADITDLRELANPVSGSNAYSAFTFSEPVVAKDPIHPGKLVTLVTQTGMLRISNVNGEGGREFKVPPEDNIPDEPNNEVMGINTADPQRDPFFYAIFGREAK